MLLNIQQELPYSGTKINTLQLQPLDSLAKLSVAAFGREPSVYKNYQPLAQAAKSSPCRVVVVVSKCFQANFHAQLYCQFI